MKLKQYKHIEKLPRGGFIINTPIGYIQFGSPPETIKDTMVRECGVPQHFVLPKKFFNWVKGISSAEVEFPIYYNFFLKQKKTYIVCEEAQKKRFVNGLEEAVFGPKRLKLREDYSSAVDDNSLPPLKNEIDFFRHQLKLSDLVEFIIFKDNRIAIEKLTITIEDEEEFVLRWEEEEFARIPSSIDYVPTYDIGKRLAEPFIPPLFGVTCLGPSHGFDPTENTSGFILWLNRKGIMIDPPVNTTEWLIDSNVSPKLIDSCILTHCHADHDAGTLQKILEEGKITVHTTPTIISSFLKKYSALTDVSESYLEQLFDYKPIVIGEPVFIHGGKFSFFYSLHSIPTIGFRLEHGGKSFVYSSDHNNDPELHEKLLREGVITEKRHKELSDFPWESDTIYHEAGIPPLHTPIAYLNSLDEAVKRKIIVYHIAKKDFPGSTNLTLAQFGMEHTLTIDVAPMATQKAWDILGLLNYLDFLENMRIDKAQEFLSIVEEEEYSKGETIIRKGSCGDKFYIIKFGNISVLTDDLEQRKIYGAYDYFGEAALITNEPRSANVIAETDVTLYTIYKDKFLHFIRNTEWKRTLERLALIRDSETWNVLSTSSAFRVLTSTQKTLLESFLHKLELKTPGTILEENSPLKRMYIIREGEVRVLKDGDEVSRLYRGDFIGAVINLHRGKTAGFSFINDKPVSLYYVEKKDALTFLNRNPGLVMKLSYDFMDG